MDIYKYAREYNADYYDPKTCVIYKVQDYIRSKRLEQKTYGIEVVDLQGNSLGYIPEPENS